MKREERREMKENTNAPENDENSVQHRVALTDPRSEPAQDTLVY